MRPNTPSQTRNSLSETTVLPLVCNRELTVKYSCILQLTDISFVDIGNIMWPSMLSKPLAVDGFLYFIKKFPLARYPPVKNANELSENKKSPLHEICRSEVNNSVTARY